ncbi:MAG: thioesterase family protein [Alphaproteobacteria bacterium]
MKSLSLGASATRIFETRREHSAAAIGNTGVDVVSSAALIGFCEIVCCAVFADLLEPGEGSVGARFDFVHLAPAHIGARITVEARVAAVDGRKLDFEAVARDSQRKLMKGHHRRVLIDLAAFMARDDVKG